MKASVFPTFRCPNCLGSGTVMDSVSTGKMLRTKRLKLKLSLRTVAHRIGISIPYLSDLERGNRSWNQILGDKYELALKKAHA